MSLIKMRYFVTLLLYSCGVLTKFCTQTNQCSEIVSKQRQHFPRVRAVLKGQEEFEEYYFILLANVSVGTPPQHFRLRIDAFRFQRLILLNYEDGSNYDVELDRYWKVGKRFEYSDSGTFSLFPRGFNDIFGIGRYGSDVVQINNFVAEIKFAILEEIDNHFIGQTWADGYLGLAPPYSLPVHRGWIEDNKIPALLQQLAHSLEKPIVSISAVPNNSMSFANLDITLGGLDTDHCQDNWRFSPQTGPGYTVRASHFTIQKGDISEGIAIDTNVYVQDNEEYGLPVAMADLVFPFLGNVTQSRTGRYTIDDCDVSKYPNLTFSIGSEEINDSWKFNFTITPADYIFYGSLFVRNYEDTHCYLLLSSFNNNTYEIVFPIQFFLRHCLAYDIKHHLVGFADRKL
ncbi:eukaryotic aspartyl protease domain-containing protein [Ditylenchus destructor]|uniref:Eukaryotic aspartyl protease domain-containing protein n=1 Tax=Ditylenchus destructor TaxID=166010 RepID=A0AAD4MM19_9BILA|nr:eukaryotic aspartyl protease domain-containing protein [Ditylenchus destructor]